MIHLCPTELLPLLSAGAILTSLWAAAWPSRWYRWICRHREMIRERREDGGIDVVCSRCGHRDRLIGATDQPEPREEAEEVEGRHG